MSNPERIISWLKYLDVEYLDDSQCKILSSLNINDPVDQTEIIRLTMRDEFSELNDVSRSSMKKILDEVDSYPESEITLVIERVGMPFQEPLKDYKKFFKKVRDYFYQKK